MLLTCPNCRSGLAVPDGTTAMVRCPACKTVFSAAENMAEPEPEDIEEEEDERPRKKKPISRDEDDDEKPRKKKASRKARDDEDEDGDEDEDEEENEKPKNRDFDPEDPEDEKNRKKKRRRADLNTFSAEEREELQNGFARATWGCKLLWISLLLFMLSMVLIIGFWFQNAFPSMELNPGFIIAAGALGLIGWIMGAVGLGLCLSGPNSPGHWGYGIAAAIATAVHLVLLAALATKGVEYSAGKAVADREGPAASWGLIPTRLDAVTYYLTFLVYKDQELIPKGEMNFSIIVGMAEILRLTLIMLFLSCVARSTGDEELSHKCTRAAGFASLGPGFMSLGMLAFAVLITESRAGQTSFTKILFTTVVMGTYAIIVACILPAFMAARDVADACEEPFQSQLPQL